MPCPEVGRQVGIWSRPSQWVWAHHCAPSLWEREGVMEEKKKVGERREERKERKEYREPELRVLGTLKGVTMGTEGSLELVC